MITIHFLPASDLPAFGITSTSLVSRAFLELGITDLRTAALFIQSKPYWKNADDHDALALLREGHGTCISKHNLLAELARENGLPVFRFEGVYPLNDTIVTGVSEVVKKHGLQEIPRTHCFLEFCGKYFDLTDGNCTGKNGLITEYFRIEKVQVDSGNQVLLRFWQDLRTVDPTIKNLSDEDFLRIAKECSEYNFGLCKFAP
ncbi:MAG: transglutaminase domain-containing protein [Fibrobacteres bacterium]|nr:transglutaminase domain-containing protein [Fibrobacterota bacterium]